MPGTSTLRVNVRETLRFFDEKPPWSAQQATAVVAVLGEDLAAAALQHCLEANDASKVTIRTETVGTGGLKGPRLDRWIEADLSSGQRLLFQTEIKNWSAHAIEDAPSRWTRPREAWRSTSSVTGQRVGMRKAGLSKRAMSPRCSCRCNLPSIRTIGPSSR